MTVHDYVKGVFSGDGKIFKLSNTENINARWRGKAFAELDTEERDEYVVALSMRLFLNKNILEMIRVCFKF